MKQWNNQLTPLLIAIFTFFALSVLLFGFISLLNLLPLQNKIVLAIRPLDVLVGLTIYVKTAIDFALFIGSLMHHHESTKNRIAIEIGTAIGNGIGTLTILAIWVFFKEIPALLIFMIFLASFVLLRMAEQGLEECQILNNFTHKVLKILRVLNKPFDPLLGKLLPRYKDNNKPHTTFLSLFIFALTIPFLLGLDDFAGYIPLFSLIDIFGFAIGVFLGHLLLTTSLFAFPNKTTQIVRQPIILLFGSIVFLGLSLWGFVEVIQGIALWLR